MRTCLVLGPLLAVGGIASPQAQKNNNTSPSVSSSTVISLQSSSIAQLASLSSSTPFSDSKAIPSSSASRPTSLLSPLSTIPTKPSSAKSSSSSSAHAVVTLTVNATLPSSRPSLSLMTLTKSFNKDNNTRLISPSRTGINATVTGPCTGCVLQANSPITTYFVTDDPSNPWTYITVTETRLVEVITYLDGTTIDTIVTEVTTVNQTKTVVVSNDATITHSTPNFRITPTPGVTLTVDAGPTYVIYNDLFGGLDSSVKAVNSADATLNACGATPTRLQRWQPMQESDWSYFIRTYTGSAPTGAVPFLPKPLPSEALQYLQNNLAMRSQYHGSNIATCTLHATAPGNEYPAFPTSHGPPAFSGQPVASIVSKTGPNNAPDNEKTISRAPYAPSTTDQETRPAFTAVPPPGFSMSTGTFLSTIYTATSTHVTRAGCLRCDDTTKPAGPTIKIGDDPAGPNNNPNILQPSYSPIDPPQKPAQSDPGRPVTIGNTVVTVRPSEPTRDPNRPNEQNQAPPVVIIGSETLTQGQSTYINGVPVVVPSDGGGSRIVVGGTTIPVNPAPTGAPILTVGQNTVTANPQGQFVVGTQTLQPGGPAITVDGSTLSLGPSGSIAIVNGITQTLANAPVITAAPVLTVGGKAITATVIGGSTQYLLGGQTLAPGAAITVDGTTYSMPSDGQGRTVIVNGVTSTFSTGQSVLPLGNQGVTATVQGGTTAFIFGPGQTLTPGGVLTISGTTFSMPASASGSVVVINGVTSTLGRGPVTAAAALTIDGKTYSATVRDGTTEFVLGQGTTLRPGQAVTISGTTYSLEPSGTALIINGRTSTIPRTPASNSATTTRSSTASVRDAGNFVWSGIGGGGGQSSSKGGAGQIRSPAGFDKWVEGIVIGAAGWLMMLL